MSDFESEMHTLEMAVRTRVQRLHIQDGTDPRLKGEQLTEIEDVFRQSLSEWVDERYTAGRPLTEAEMHAAKFRMNQFADRLEQAGWFP